MILPSTRDWFWYGYIATGYKAGGFTDKVDLCGGISAGTLLRFLNAFPYEPERNVTYETGFKGVLYLTVSVLVK